MFMRKKSNARRAASLVTLLAFVAGFAGSPASRAQAAVPAGIDPAVVRAAAVAAGLGSLADVPVPGVANLGEFLNAGPAAKTAAIRLGKALFWDMQVGSDGQACASCHFQAGADNRVRNQLNPGLKAGDSLFGNNTLGVQGFPQFRPDYTLKPADFPFHVLTDPEENNFLNRVVTADTNDVVSSQGVFPAAFERVILGVPGDIGIPFVDPIFNLMTPNAESIFDNVIRVEPRNTPTMINAVFNHSNFWDGRAHNQFNGVSPIGPLDEGARIWVNNNGTLEKVQVSIPNSSLASQAVGPPGSNLEMSFFDRPFPQIGRKLLSLTPLGMQVVHPKDSVLGPYSLSPQRGVNLSYEALIEEAFQARYWDSATPTPDGYTLMEANFSLFFGLAVQMYEATLVADKTPFDLFMAGDDAALTQEQLQGLLVFVNRGARGNFPDVVAALAAAQTALGVAIGAGNCSSCHGGPELTDAAVASVEAEPIEIETTAVLIGGLLQVDPATSFVDNGFANIGVRPTAEDLGRGGLEGGFPLSFVRQALLELPFAPPLNDECGGVDEFGAPLPPCPVDNRLSADGAFKIPGLRNVELTGPYFHNGGQATLDQVVEFYDRQGDFSDVNVGKLERNMAFIDMHDVDEEPLVEFLESLTDPRVRWERAPFDHPQLLIPNGGTFLNEQTRIVVPAVGAGGRPTEGLPTLKTFETMIGDPNSAVTQATGATLTPYGAPSPQQPGSVITFNAGTTGGDAGPYEYRFFWRPSGATTYTQGNAYSTNPTWTWDTSKLGLPAGTYAVRVNVRHVGSSVSYETSKAINYKLVAPATGATLTPGVASPQPAGTSITFTAAATGGDAGPYEYRFYWRPPGATSYTQGRAYSTDPSWSWNTAALGLPAGTYTILVHTRHVGSPLASEVKKAISYTLTTPGLGTNLTPSVATPQPAGTSITFTAAATGGDAGPYEYRFYWRPPGATSYTLGRAYSTTPTWTWNTADLGLPAGTYTILVHTRHVGSALFSEVKKSIKFVLN